MASHFRAESFGYRHGPRGYTWESGTAGEGGAPDYELFIDAGVGQNVVRDPSFDESVALWSHFGMGVVERLETGCATDPRCLRSAQRGDYWTGPVYDLRGYVIPGRDYEARIWARTAEPSTVKLSTKTLCQGATASTFDTVTELGSAGDWVELVGVVRIQACPMVSLQLLVEGPDGGVDLDVDDVSVVLAE